MQVSSTPFTFSCPYDNQRELEEFVRTPYFGQLFICNEFNFLQVFLTMSDLGNFVTYIMQTLEVAMTSQSTDAVVSQYSIVNQLILI